MVLGQLFGGIAGINKDRHMEKQAETSRNRGLGLFGLPNADMWYREPLFDTRDRFKRESVANIKKGFGAAKRNLRGAGVTAMREARTTGMQTQAAAQQSMASRGLFNTTVMDNASRGISSDTSRAVQDIQLKLGELNSQLEMDKMEAMDMALGRNLGLDEQSAWDFFKFMVGSAGFAPGSSNAFGFGSPYDQGGNAAQHWGNIGGGVEDALAGLLGGLSSGGGAVGGSGWASASNPGGATPAFLKHDFNF